MLKKTISFLAFILLLSSCSENKLVPKPASEYPILTNDGAWCWFSDPRAIYHHTADGSSIITGWVKQDGTIEAGELNLISGTHSSKILFDKMERDDHDNPAFVECKDGSVLAHYTRHGDGAVYQNKTDKSGRITTFSSTQSIDVIDSLEMINFPRKTITYANPFQLDDENGRIYCFGRWTGFKPNMMWSDDSGENWTKARVFLTNYPFDANNRPYVKYFSDGKSKIHIVFTDGHPRMEPTNSVYYAYYEHGAFYKAGGEKICDIESMPFEPKQATLVYKATKELGKAWIFDVATDFDENPVIAYTRYPNDEDHRYHYAIFKDGKWIDNEICASGKWFPQTAEGTREREPNYSAGIVLHPYKTNTVYLSRNVNGVFEIEKRTTPDDGLNWSIFPITQGSKNNNVRPVVPRNYQKGDPDVVLWMENEKYLHYTNYQASIRYLIEN